MNIKPKTIFKRLNVYCSLRVRINRLREVNLIFAVLVLGTLAISGRISRKLKKQSAGRKRIAAQRSKAWAILFIEVVIWIGFNVFYEFSRANWLWIGIGGVVVIGIILSRQRKRYA